MSPMTRRRRLVGLAVVAALITTALVGAAVPAAAEIEDGTRFYVPKPNHEAVHQIATLTRQGRKVDAAKIRAMIDTPTAVWVESGSPKKAEQQVRQVTRQAAGKNTVPVLVLYNIPFRDCAQYSAGGATSVAEYEAWIDGVVRGIGRREAVIALEPDGLGIIPWYTNVDGTLEWCQPAEADRATAATERFAMLNYAVDRLTALPNTSVYLDGTHSGWLNVGDITDRLLKAGVEKADGFFLNASNYQWTPNLEQYGTWISSCIAYVTRSSRVTSAAAGTSTGAAVPPTTGPGSPWTRRRSGATQRRIRRLTPPASTPGTTRSSATSSPPRRS